MAVTGKPLSICREGKAPGHVLSPGLIAEVYSAVNPGGSGAVRQGDFVVSYVGDFDNQPTIRPMPMGRPALPRSLVAHRVTL
jgi:hypothetical protein